MIVDKNENRKIRAGYADSSHGIIYAHEFIINGGCGSYDYGGRRIEIMRRLISVVMVSFLLMVPALAQNRNHQGHHGQNYNHGYGGGGQYNYGYGYHGSPNNGYHYHIHYNGNYHYNNHYHNNNYYYPQSNWGFSIGIPFYGFGYGYGYGYGYNAVPYPPYGYGYNAVPYPPYGTYGQGLAIAPTPNVPFGIPYGDTPGGSSVPYQQYGVQPDAIDQLGRFLSVLGMFPFSFYYVGH